MTRPYQKKLIDEIYNQERKYIEQRYNLCKFHHLLREYGLSKHSLYVRNLACSILEFGAKTVKEWIYDWNEFYMEEYCKTGDKFYLETMTTSYQYYSAVKLAKRLQLMFYGGCDGVLNLIKEKT